MYLSNTYFTPLLGNKLNSCYHDLPIFADGILLLEVNRMLRAGGYFAWAAQPVYKHEEAQQEAWKGIVA